MTPQRLLALVAMVVQGLSTMAQVQAQAQGVLLVVLVVRVLTPAWQVLVGTVLLLPPGLPLQLW